MAPRKPDERHDTPAAPRLPDEPQGFVRGGDVDDTRSQAAAPRHPAQPLDRGGEKQYAHSLRRFERQHADAAPPGRAPRSLDDANAVRDAIDGELARDPELRRVVVATRQRRVTLSGEVADAAARERAQELAAAASGVEEVVNHIIVRA